MDGEATNASKEIDGRSVDDCGDVEGVPSTSSKEIRALEFYSGLGGMRYALESLSGWNGKVLAAYEINDLANDVYQHNFGDRPLQRNIAAIKAKELDGWKAQLWLLSPPCQPYTRNGLQKDALDGRAESFLILLNELSKMKHPPSGILVENVVGFETSITRKTLVTLLERERYQIEECILSPYDLGIPYTRPRYFLLASRKKNHGNDSPTPEVRWLHGPPLGWERIIETSYVNRMKSMRCWERGCRLALIHFLETELSLRSEQMDSPASLLEGHEDMHWNEWHVPDSVLRANWNVFDVVAPSFTRCNCFTKSYSRYAKGTGSILVQVAEKDIVEGQEEEKGFWVARNGEFLGIKTESARELQRLSPRYFTPREIANLHCFPDDFCFPSHVTIKQQYAMLGNGLNSAVVAILIAHMCSPGFLGEDCDV